MKKTTLFILTLIALTMAACGTAPATPQATQVPIVIADSSVVAEGHLEPVHFAEIAFSTSGVVDSVLVEEGQQVKQGQRLIQLGGELDKNFTAAQTELVSAQQAMDDLLHSRDADLAKATITLKDAKEDYERAENYLTYLRNNKRIPQTKYSADLVNLNNNGWTYNYEFENFRGPAPKDWIVEAENDLALKKAEYEEAQRVYDRLKDGPDAEQLLLLEARLNAAEAGVASFEVIAPFDGLVARLDAKVGSSINAGEIAVVIADTSSWIVATTDVNEIDVVKLNESQPVTVTLDAMPDLILKGNILTIGQSYSENQGDIVYEVTILLADRNPSLRWGMTAVVKFAE